MRNKLMITRTTAYLLSSIITIPFLVKQNFESEVMVFTTVMYVIIYLLTKYFAYNYSLKWIHILVESIMTTLISFIGGIIIASPIVIFGHFGISGLFLPILIGIPSSLVIGLILFIMNYIIIIILKNTDSL